MGVNTEDLLVQGSSLGSMGMATGMELPILLTPECLHDTGKLRQMLWGVTLF